MAKTIYLSNGMECLVDDEDYAFLNRYAWHFCAGYAAADICGRRMQMHRLLTNCPPGAEVDHKNRSKLDNRKCNLRNCLHANNGMNKIAKPGKAVPYKGVVFDARDGTYTASITIDKKRFVLCYTKDPVEAAMAYDAAARYHFGQFALTNFPGDDARPASQMKPATRRCKNRTAMYRGVRRTKNGTWQAMCHKKHIGVFGTQEEAAQAYDRRARELLGDKAILNFRQ